jgi:hypothetical protein
MDMCDTKSALIAISLLVVCPEMVKMLLAKAGFDLVKESVSEANTNTYLSRDYLVVFEKRASKRVE